MYDYDEALRTLKELQAQSERLAKGLETDTQRIRLDKQTHRIRFEDETEESVTIVIERKAGGGLPPPA
jgi:hypothetical protein